jgi:hypothetical protein
MAIVHAQVVRTVKLGDTPKDYCVNNVYHTIGGSFPDPTIDYQNHANEIRDAFAGLASPGGSFQLYSNSGILVKVYAQEEPRPRLPKAQATYTPTNWASYAMGPRDVQCCLSFYHSNPSVKSERGRIYIGPWPAARLSEHVDPLDLNMLLDLGNALFNIGGENVAHVVYSPTHNKTSVVQHYWCNNQWDTIRSRDVKETNRVTLAP